MYTIEKWYNLRIQDKQTYLDGQKVDKVIFEDLCIVPTGEYDRDVWIKIKEKRDGKI